MERLCIILRKNGNGADAQFRGGAGDKLKSRSYST
jgi:hypothetical protein